MLVFIFPFDGIADRNISCFSAKLARISLINLPDSSLLFRYKIGYFVAQYYDNESVYGIILRHWLILYLALFSQYSHSNNALHRSSCSNTRQQKSNLRSLCFIRKDNFGILWNLLVWNNDFTSLHIWRV